MFNQKKHIEKLLREDMRKWIEPERPWLYKDKPFYKIEEWYGWRFYLKAIKYRDWDSIKKHIKQTYKIK